MSESLIPDDDFSTTRTPSPHPAPVLLAGAPSLADWIRAGGPPERRVRLLNARLAWQGWWFERHLAMSAARLPPAPLPDDPVFIVGFWRTGSTLLHSRLAAATGWTTPLTWQCFRPSSLLLHAPTRSASVSRPMDQGVISTFSPQEDEFAALLLGEPSLYRNFIDPRRLDDAHALLRGWNNQSSAEPALSSRWENFVRSVLTLSPGRLLLKSPNHTFRLPWLAARFPNARFVWLTRPKAALLSSNRSMWLSMMARYGLWSANTRALDQLLHQALVTHDDIKDWAQRALADRLITVDFQDILNDTDQLTEQLTHALR